MPEPSDDGDEADQFSDLYAEDMDSDARLLAIIDRVKEHIFDKPFPRPMIDAMNEKMGIKLNEMSLTGREINVVEGVCPEGHIHREIVLVETFGKAASPAPPDLNLDIAMDRVRTLGATVPPTALGRHQEDHCNTMMGTGKDGNVVRAFSVSQVFETEASLTGRKNGIPPGMRAMMALRRARGGGPDLSFGG